MFPNTSSAQVLDAQDLSNDPLPQSMKFIVSNNSNWLHIIVLADLCDSGPIPHKSSSAAVVSARFELIISAFTTANRYHDGY